MAPWSPKPEYLADPRLDSYRSRVAELRRGSELVGHAMVLTEYVAEATRGHLWWTRWAPFEEVPSLSVILFDGRRVDDSWTHPPALAAELEHWSRDEMTLLGEVLSTRWFGVLESLEIARSRFGVDGFDESGRVTWKTTPEKEPG